MCEFGLTRISVLCDEEFLWRVVSSGTRPLNEANGTFSYRKFVTFEFYASLNVVVRDYIRRRCMWIKPLQSALLKHTQADFGCLNRVAYRGMFLWIQTKSPLAGFGTIFLSIWVVESFGLGLGVQEASLRRMFDARDESGGGGFIPPESLASFLEETAMEMPQNDRDGESMRVIQVWLKDERFFRDSSFMFIVKYRGRFCDGHRERVVPRAPGVCFSEPVHGFVDATSHTRYIRSSRLCQTSPVDLQAALSDHDTIYLSSDAMVPAWHA